VGGSGGSGVEVVREASPALSMSSRRTRQCSGSWSKRAARSSSVMDGSASEMQ